MTRLRWRTKRFPTWIFQVWGRERFRRTIHAWDTHRLPDGRWEVTAVYGPCYPYMLTYANGDNPRTRIRRVRVSSRAPITAFLRLLWTYWTADRKHLDASQD